jgi:hypothetical protein
MHVRTHFHTFLISVLDMWVVSFTLCPFYALVRMDRKVGGPRTGLEAVVKRKFPKVW